MKTKHTILSVVTLAILLGLLAFRLVSTDITTLEIGARAPLIDLGMMDVSGAEISLKNKMNKNGLLVIFSCNTCPFVIGRNDSEGWEARYNDVARQAEQSNVGMILVNSNEAKRESGDSFDDMISRSKEKMYSMAYVMDKDNVLADAFGARTTPHVFLFNNNYELVYKGAIDDNSNNYAKVKENWLKNAMIGLSNGEKIDPQTTKNLGCSIKRVKKED